MEARGAMDRATAALQQMQALVAEADFAGAAACGNAHAPQLAVSRESLVLRERISQGACSTVFAGELDGGRVAVKKAHIRVSADLQRLRKELCMLVALSHCGITPLLAARALPPEYLLVMPLLSPSLEVRC